MAKPVHHFHISVAKSLGLFFGVLLIVATLISGYAYFQANNQLGTKNAIVAQLEEKRTQLEQEIERIRQELTDLQNQDQVAINKALEEEIKNINTTYKKSVAIYEDLVDLRELSNNTAKLDQLYASSISILANKNYASASAQLDQLSRDIATEKAKVVVAAVPQAQVANLLQSNTPPGSGYSRQTVNSDTGSFIVSVVAADLGSTKVIVDTASDSDCGNNCPVLPLATYVSRNGAFAGINGTYFCPASYPSCAGKTNTFDLLVMNKNKTYFNSANNVYSNNPVVVFQSGSMRFIGSGSGWGRDTGVDSVLMNYPLLVSGGNVSFGGDDDPKKGSKGNRSFVANKGSIGYIGVVHSATVAEAARVLKAMGMENALNLDNGGSTALWSGGYKLGPGRDLPNAILFVRR